MLHIRWIALATADAAVLTGAAPDVARLGNDLGDLPAWADRVGADRAAEQLAGAALWCVAAWVALGLLAGLASTLPGTAGRCADRLARRVLPAACYRLVAGAAGLGVLVAPVAAGAFPPPAAASSAPAPAWPSDAPIPAPAWPTTADRPPAPSTPAPAPAPARPRQPTVVVRSGDSLWSIAAAQLPGAGPQRIAREWPRWFATNRGVIGADPDLIRPGQVLHAPAPIQEHRP